MSAGHWASDRRDRRPGDGHRPSSVLVAFAARSRVAFALIAASRRAATPSRSSSNRSAYTSRVMDALASPSIRCTAFTLAPALTAELAAVCRKSCGVIVGNVSSTFWHSAATA